MKRDDLVNKVAMRLKILHLQDFNYFQTNELPLSYLLEKLAETALDTLQKEGVVFSELIESDYFDSEDD